MPQNWHTFEERLKYNLNTVVGISSQYCLSYNIHDRFDPWESQCECDRRKAHILGPGNHDPVEPSGDSSRKNCVIFATLSDVVTGADEPQLLKS